MPPFDYHGLLNFLLRTLFLFLLEVLASLLVWWILHEIEVAEAELSVGVRLQLCLIVRLLKAKMLLLKASPAWIYLHRFSGFYPLTICVFRSMLFM